MKYSFLKLIACIAVSELAGFIGSLFTISAIPGWYATLTMPALNPPSWLFGPVWITLYALMGISLFLVWKNYSLIRTNERMVRVWKISIAVFFVQLILNALWSIIFFGLKSPAWALVDIVALWLSIIWMMILFWKISKPATLLIVPYILWVSFAIYLNYSILILN